MIVIMIRVTVKTKSASKNNDFKMACDRESARVGISEGAKAVLAEEALERAEERSDEV